MMNYTKTLSMAFALEILGRSCFALQTYPLLDQESTHITISQTEQNRIAVYEDRIQQVFGAEGIFDVQSDEEGGQIFLILRDAGKWQEPHLESSLKPTTITIITESGLTQDLKLIPKAIDSQSILFKPHYLPQEVKESHQPVGSPLQHIISLMKAMVRNEEVEGYTKMSLTKLDRLPLGTSPSGALPLGISPYSASKSGIPLLKTLKVDPLFLYKGESFEGKVYVLTNQGNDPLHLKEEDFSLQEDVALYISKKTLHPKETINLYVVSRLALSPRVKPEDETRGRAS